MKKYLYRTLSISKNIPSIIAMALALIAMSGCQSMTPLEVSSSIKNVDFNQYKSIQVQSLNDPERKVIGYLNTAIESHMRGKGYDVSEQADLVIAYQLVVENKQRIDLKNVSTVKGNVYTIPKLEPVNEASILINAYDPKLAQVVWKASTIRDVTSVNPKDVDQERINTRVEELFETFPSLNNAGSLFY